MGTAGRIYFHAPCFDGVVSAALAWEVLERRLGWETIHLEPVGYEVRRSWVGRRLPEPFAIVDFLFHARAALFADHHPTTFVQPGAARSFRPTNLHVYDPSAPSCARLLWRSFRPELSRRPHFRKLVEAADRIDAAEYQTPEEAVFGTLPADRIRDSLAGERDDEFIRDLVLGLRDDLLEPVSRWPQVRRRAAQWQAGIEVGVAHVKKALRVRPSGVATFSVRNGDAPVPRYGAFLFAPKARYSLGLVRGERGAKLTAMRNPWLSFQGVHLGQTFARFGGGGHERVASVLLPQGGEAATQVMQRVLRAIEEAERARGAGTC